MVVDRHSAEYRARPRRSKAQTVDDTPVSSVSVSQFHGQGVTERSEPVPGSARRDPRVSSSADSHSNAACASRAASGSSTRSLAKASVTKPSSSAIRRVSPILDPGPDFAKTPSQTVIILRRLPELGRFRRPILLAVSRKDFIGALTGRMPGARLAGTLAAIGEGIDAGASILPARPSGSPTPPPPPRGPPPRTDAADQPRPEFRLLEDLWPNGAEPLSSQRKLLF